MSVLGAILNAFALHRSWILMVVHKMT